MPRFDVLGVLALALPLSACADPVFGLAEGESCERSVQCGPGLACVMGVCDPDPTGLGGEVPGGGGVGDGGGVIPPGDGGPTPPPDAGGTPPDPPDPVDAG